MHRSLLVFTGVLGLLAGCPGDDGGTTETAAMTDTTPSTESGMSTSGMSSSTTNGMSTSSTTMDTTTEPMTSTMEPETSSTTSTTTMTGTDTDPTGGGDACAKEPGDDECSMCLKTMCCDELQTCRDSEDCSCMLDCLDAMGMGPAGIPACLMPDQCDLDGLPPEALPLSMCQSKMCDACNM
jgi:hypothetical protein